MRFEPGHSGARFCPAWRRVFDCDPWARHEAGDHVLFIAKVKHFRCFADRQPLVFGKGRYASLQPTEFTAPLWPLDIHY